MFGERAPLKEGVLDALTAQSRATNMVGDDYLRTIESWQTV
jgi:hypothetical protein